jgi:hypothetical protein
MQTEPDLFPRIMTIEIEARIAIHPHLARKAGVAHFLVEVPGSWPDVPYGSAEYVRVLASADLGVAVVINQDAVGATDQSLPAERARRHRSACAVAAGELSREPSDAPLQSRF